MRKIGDKNMKFAYVMQAKISVLKPEGQRDSQAVSIFRKRSQQ